VTDYGKKVSNFASILHNTAPIVEILPRRESDKPLLNLIIVRKRQRKRASDGDEETEEENKLTALNFYSKREFLSPPRHALLPLHTARINISARHCEIL